MPTQKGPARWAGPFSYASLAQSVEHAAVNRRVVGSSPTGGAKMRLAAKDDGKPFFPAACVRAMGL